MKIGTSGTRRPAGALKRAYDLLAELERFDDEGHSCRWEPVD